MDFLELPDNALVQMANELEFSQLEDLDDIILSQVPLDADDIMLSQIKTDDINCSGDFRLEFNLDDLGWENTSGSESPADGIDTKQSYLNSNSRWAKPVDDEQINELVNDSKNKNTSKNTKWAFNVFTSWRESREENIPFLLDMDPEQISFWLSRFVCETRKQNGKPYPSKTLYLIMCGLLRYLRDNNVFNYNFLDENDARFAKLNKVLESKMKQLVEQGVDTPTKSADPVLADEEDKLWNLGVFGNNSAESLQLTVFFYACKFFGLRGFDEHRSLESGQFTVGKDDRGKWIQFIGKSTKTNKGGLGTVKLEKKNIRHFYTEGPRCLADLFEQYLQAIGEGYFYKRPLSGTSIRYSIQPVGVKLVKVVSLEIILIIVERKLVQLHYMTKT